MKYRALVGIDYNPPEHKDIWRHWEAGDVIDPAGIPKRRGLPPVNLERLLRRGAIEEVSNGEVLV